MAAKRKKQDKGSDPKPRTKKDITELAREVVKASQAADGEAYTLKCAVEKLEAADKAKPGQVPLDLVKNAVGPAIADVVFTNPKAKGKPKQQTLPRKHPSGPELTHELCDLEMRLRKQTSALGDALADLEGAKARVKECQAEREKTQEAIADALYDLRLGQGRIEFPKKAETGTQAA